ncbi:hypothetical protein [Sphingobacterium pedocola]|uniref:Lipocalin-like domain-containing protein n=1 Tax=Sphingobacterium pedocola TaxID=2082722 RepID=A0ABR9T3F2_9SPHI|nr:hypothetical protein [Sphingobacterium pedocola]MBE8719876.1 hypothetical protein [Sphingobacterium pedocola]
MRKHILSVVSLFTVVLLLASCGAPKKGTSGSSSATSTSASGPSASQWRSGVKGNWVLNTVTREDVPAAYTIKNIFDEAPVDCFIGSIWNLPGGNYRGSITFNADGTLCANGAVRTIVWSIYGGSTTEEPQFQFKKIYAGDKAANVTTGYRMNLSFADGETLVMKMPIPLDNGQQGNLVFNFTKVDR